MNKVTAMRPWQRRLRIAEIRDMAIAQLFYKRDDFDHDGHRDELAALVKAGADALTPDGLEAEIALTLAFGSRPRRAQKPLYRLYKQRLARREADQFQRFVAVLERAKDHGISLDGIYMPQSFATMDHDMVWADLRALFEKLDAAGVQVFLNSGTLLGVVRDKALIAHDDDVDLAVVFEADSQEAAAEAWIATQKQLSDQGLLVERRGPNPGVVKLVSDGSYNVDLFPAWIEKGRVYVYPHTSGHLNDRDVMPLQACKVSGLPIPADPEAMLAQNYGDGWRVPDPSYAFPWAEANRAFAAFRKALDA